MNGTADALAGTLQLASTGVGKATPSGSGTFPLFARSSGQELTLTLTPQGFSGDVGREGWSLSVPVEGVVAEGTPSPLDDADLAGGEVPYPSTSGAYILVGKSWIPLPRNQGGSARGEVGVTNKIFSLLRGVQDVATGRLPDVRTEDWTTVVFDGREGLPVVASGPVTIAYIGTIEPVRTEVLVQHPELKTHPAVELAAIQVGADGRRTVGLLRLVPGLLSLGTARLAATLEQPQPGVTLLRSTGVVPPGHYAINCAGRLYEVVAS